MMCVAAELKHVPALIALLSAEKHAELVSMCEQVNMAAVEMMSRSLDGSVERGCWLDDDGAPIAIFGCCVVDIGAVVWMIGIEERIEGHKKFFLAESKRWVNQVADNYGTLRATVAKTERKSLRWMDWLGFRQVGEVAAFGKEAWQLERLA